MQKEDLNSQSFRVASNTIKKAMDHSISDMKNYVSYNRVKWNKGEYTKYCNKIATKPFCESSGCAGFMSPAGYSHALTIPLVTFENNKYNTTETKIKQQKAEEDSDEEQRSDLTIPNIGED